MANRIAEGSLLTEFKFIHAADLHLGSPFRGLALKEPEVARRFAEASRTAFSDLVSGGIEEGVDFMVIAGDIYDGDWRDNSIGLFFNRELGRLERAGIEVFLLRGNHDAESVVTRSVSLPQSARQFSTKVPETFRIERLQVALHGQGFAERAVTDNLVTKYPDHVPGWFNIGVLHTALTGRPPHDTYAPCSAGHLRARGYEYWALGHVHEFELVGTQPYIVFPGNLQGRSIREQGEKGAVLVSVADGEVIDLERLIVDRARWAEVRLDARGLDSQEAVIRAAEEALQPLREEAESRLVALRFAITGETALHRQLVARREQLADEMQAAAHRVHGDIWLEKLDLRTKGLGRRRSQPSVLAADFSSLLEEMAGSAELHDKAVQFLADIKLRIPGAIPADEQDLEAELDTLIAEAREVLLLSAAEPT
jgi:DNA repair exonuclease SbcCD nuclease subunit